MSNPPRVVHAAKFGCCIFFLIEQCAGKGPARNDKGIAPVVFVAILIGLEWDGIS